MTMSYKMKQQKMCLNNAGSNNSLIEKTTDKELCKLLENFSKKTLRSKNTSQNSLFVNNAYPNSTSLLKEILAKESKANRKSKNVIKLNHDLKNKNIYLMATEDHEIENDKQEIISRNKKYEDLLKLKQRLNLENFRNHKKDEMEVQCQNLENKIKTLKTDLLEMEKCLYLMREIKSNFSAEISKIQSDSSKKYRGNVVQQKTPLHTSNANNITIDSSCGVNGYLTSKTSSSLKAMLKEKMYTNSSKYAESSASRSTSNSNACCASECTRVSSSIINESSFKVSIENQLYSNEIPSIINDETEIVPNSFANNCNQYSHDSRSNFFKKLWHNMKVSIKSKRAFSQIKTRYLKIGFKNKDNSSLSQYFTATENKTLSMRNK